MRQYIWVGGGHYIMVRAKDLRAARRLFNKHALELSLDIKESFLYTKDIASMRDLVLDGKPYDSIKIDDKVKPGLEYWPTIDRSK